MATMLMNGDIREFLLLVWSDISSELRIFIYLIAFYVGWFPVGMNYY
jgi:hypothetical protein